MQLTKESDYALTGLAVLVASGDDAPLPLSSIAEARSLPEAYLARIFRRLARQGILDAKRGRGNGYSLSRPADSISLRDVIEAVEGATVFERCLLWRDHCHDENPCPLHHRLEELRPRVEELLETTSLADYVSESPHALLDAAGVGSSD